MGVAGTVTWDGKRQKRVSGQDSHVSPHCDLLSPTFQGLCFQQLPNDGRVGLAAQSVLQNDCAAGDRGQPPCSEKKTTQRLRLNQGHSEGPPPKTFYLQYYHKGISLDVENTPTFCFRRTSGIGSRFHCDAHPRILAHLVPAQGSAHIQLVFWKRNLKEHFLFFPSNQTCSWEPLEL